MEHFKINLSNSINKLDKWVTMNNYKAYDPFDGLSSSYTKYLTFNNPILKIVLQQSVRRFPINIRPLIGIKKEISTKAMGFFAQGYLNLYLLNKEDKYLEKVKQCLNYLIDNYSKNYSGYCWGNHFDYQSRGGDIPKGVPTIVWTSLICNAFLDAYENLGEEKYLRVARSSCDFIFKDLYKLDHQGTTCIGYTPQKKDSVIRNAIHNSNMFGASLLARVYSHTGEKELIDLAKKSVLFTVRDQLDSGGWYYGLHKKWHWIDLFHTGYVLESLHYYIKYSKDEEHMDVLKKGYDYFINNFFSNDGIPKYYHNRKYPIDIQCASQGIQTLINLKSFNNESSDIAKKVALWTIENMQDKSGYFYFRKYPVLINKTPTLHWGQATMFAALTLLNYDLNKDNHRG